MAAKSRIGELTRLERLHLGQIRRKKPAGKEWSFQLHLLRLREIERLIQHRHGKFIPDTDDAIETYIMAAAFTLRSEHDVKNWCARWAPWALEKYDTLVAPLITKACARKYMQGADPIGIALCVTYDERQFLEFNTIGCFDVPKAKRKQLAKQIKRERDRNRQEAKRRASGMQDRSSEQPQSLEKSKPWLAEGISRRTWFRRRGTEVSQVGIINIGDKPVPSEVQAMPPIPSLQKTSSVAGRGGLGPQAPAGFQGTASLGSSEQQRGKAA